MDIWERLTGLAAAPPDSTRVGAALVLLRDLGGDLEIVYTRRRDDLRSHPGQISFPGGRVDVGETVEEAAVREAWEEVALDPSTVTVLGRLPAFYIPPSRFWLQPVVARWDAPHPLVAAEAEVAAVLQVPLSLLRDPACWRGVRMSTAGWSWAWDLGGGNLLWGATAVVTAALLDLLDPGWTRGMTPGDLPADRHVQPWLRGRPEVPVRGPARLPGTAQRSADDLPAGVVGGPDETSARAAGRAVAAAVRRLGDAGPVTVLTGSGWTGMVGLRAAGELARHGVDVHTVGDGDLPHDSIVVDALVGRGLDGELRGAALEIAHRLRAWEPIVVAVDLPSGLDPRLGMIGELIPADITVAIGQPARGLFRPGLSPFVGDLYVAPLVEGEDPLIRLVPGPDGARWRE